MKGKIFMSERYKGSAAKTVLIVMLIIELIVVLCVFMLTMAFKDSESKPSLFGYSFYISDVKEMDSAVKKGSLVVAKNGTVDTSQIGCVMLCDEVEGFDTSIFRLVDVEATNETLLYKMCMDDVPNYTLTVSAEAVVGECKYSYYGLGRFISFVTSKVGVIVCVLVPSLILAIIELVLGFVKEMKKRDLQKKRQKVREEQAKEHSTKHRRTHSTNAKEFVEEDKRLKNMHKRKKGELPSLYRSASENKKTDDKTRVMNKPSKKRIEEKTKVIDIPQTNTSEENLDNNVVNVGEESQLRVRLAAEKKEKERLARLEKTAAIETQAREEIKAELEQVIEQAEPVNEPIHTEPVHTAPAPKPVSRKPIDTSSFDDLLKMIDSEHEKLRKSTNDNK